MKITALLISLACAATLAAGQGAIGVMFMNDPSPGVLAHFGGVAEGAVVMEAAEGGPAAKAGLRLGDVVVAIGGKPIASFEDVRELLGGLEPGTKIDVTYRRHKEKQDDHDETTVTVEVVDRDTFWKAELERLGVEEKP